MFFFSISLTKYHNNLVLHVHRLVYFAERKPAVVAAHRVAAVDSLHILVEEEEDSLHIHHHLVADSLRSHLVVDNIHLLLLQILFGQLPLDLGVVQANYIIMLVFRKPVVTHECTTYWWCLLLVIVIFSTHFAILIISCSSVKYIYIKSCIIVITTIIYKLKKKNSV